MSDMIPCTNPAHGVQSHIAGTQVALECRSGSKVITGNKAIPTMMTTSSSGQSEAQKRADSFMEGLEELEDGTFRAGDEVVTNPDYDQDLIPGRFDVQYALKYKREDGEDDGGREPWDSIILTGSKENLRRAADYIYDRDESYLPVRGSGFNVAAGITPEEEAAAAKRVAARQNSDAIAHELPSVMLDLEDLTEEMSRNPAYPNTAVGQLSNDVSRSFGSEILSEPSVSANLAGTVKSWLRDHGDAISSVDQERLRDATEQLQELSASVTASPKRLGRG